MPTKVLFINQEISPYVPETPMAYMGRELPERIQEAGYEIRTFMPKWGIINERRGQLHEVIRLSGMNIVVNDNDHPLLIKVASLPTSRAQIYFIDNEEYFSRRKMTTDDDGKPFHDNGERAIFFARGVLETVKKLRWTPDIILCQGWMTAVVPLYVKTVYSDEPCFAEAKIITAIYPEEFPGELEDNFKHSIEYKEVTQETLSSYKEKFDSAELNKFSIDFSDGIILTSTTVNTELKKYAKEKRKMILECENKTTVEEYKTFIEKLNKK